MALPEVPSTFSSVFGMGAVKHVYPVKKATKWGGVIGMVIFLGSAVIVLFAGILYTYDQWQTYGPAVVIKSNTLPLSIAAILLFLGFLTSWSVYSNWKKAVVVYHDGFAYADRKGIRVWRWAEIASLTSAVTRHYTNGVYTGTTHIYTVESNDGARIILNDSISKVEEVSDDIRQNIFPLLYERYANAYNSGKKLSFGPMALSKTEGIQMGKKSYAWDQIAQISVQRGQVQIAKRGGGWFSGATAATSTIPNLEIMLSIVDQVLLN